jgi:hypothetical protein
MSLETVVGFLTEAQKIVRDLQPVNWQFLEAPPDNSVLLCWQPLEYLDTNFASDGYVWVDTEQAFTQELRGYVRAQISFIHTPIELKGSNFVCRIR